MRLLRPLAWSGALAGCAGGTPIGDNWMVGSVVVLVLVAAIIAGVSWKRIRDQWRGHRRDRREDRREDRK